MRSLVYVATILATNILQVSASANSTAPTSHPPKEVTLFVEYIHLLHVDEVPSAITVSFTKCSYWTERNRRNGRENLRVPELTVEKSIEEKRFFEKLDNLPGSRMRHCYSSVTKILCPHFNLREYPKDQHSCDLMFMARNNTTEVTLLPHLLTDEKHTMGNTAWSMNHLKTYVQWVTIENEDFEMVVISFMLIRNSFLLELLQRSAALLNSLLIFAAFPIGSLRATSKSASSSLLIGSACQILLWIVAAHSSPSILEFPLLVCTRIKASDRDGSQVSETLLEIHGFRRMSLFVVVSMVVTVVAYAAPLLALSFRCTAYGAHPHPIDFPTPNELLSLDSERTKYSSALDSARVDSTQSQRNANFDLCLAQVRYTLSAVNEHLSVIASAKWHRKQWIDEYARIEFFLLVSFQLLNLIVILFCSGD
ncbi:hypothetical protein Q1695_003900 [Nippostrongylus brasiliensis]|nr:hypothetical protein Q1695_003900 [Nippostrongylus brasiliensis]